MTDWTFFVAPNQHGHDCLWYGDPNRDRMWSDVVAARSDMDRMNLVIWRRLVFATTGEWPVCDFPGCVREDRRHSVCSDKPKVGDAA